MSSHPQPTVVLVHGAFADSGFWNGVIVQLARAGVPATAFANPLRSVAFDAEALSDRLRTLDGPVVLVGHAYGGHVITNVDPTAADVVAAVYVCASAPAPGESVTDLVGHFAGSTLADALEPVRRGAHGETDLYIARAAFHKQFCGDVEADVADLMAATQRPITQEALEEPSGDEHCLWRDVPSYFVVATGDHHIPAATQRWMAERAAARGTLELSGGSHAVAVARPVQVAELILEAATVPVAA